MGDDEAAMLAAIAGGDDAARLVYADWLEQHGRPACADFVRVQEQRAAAAPGSRAFTDATPVRRRCEPAPVHRASVELGARSDLAIARRTRPATWHQLMG